MDSELYCQQTSKNYGYDWHDSHNMSQQQTATLKTNLDFRFDSSPAPKTQLLLGLAAERTAFTTSAVQLSGDALPKLQRQHGPNQTPCIISSTVSGGRTGYYSLSLPSIRQVSSIWQDLNGTPNSTAKKCASMHKLVVAPLSLVCTSGHVMQIIGQT